MSKAKGALRLAIVFGAAFLFFDLTTIVDRRSYFAAFSTYVHDRTPENEARLRSEARMNELVKAEDAAVEAGIVTAFVFGVFTIYRALRRRKNACE
jgi:hypothetical protein